MSEIKTPKTPQIDGAERNRDGDVRGDNALEGDRNGKDIYNSEDRERGNQIADVRESEEYEGSTQTQSKAEPSCHTIEAPKYSPDNDRPLTRKELHQKIARITLAAGLPATAGLFVFITSIAKSLQFTGWRWVVLALTTYIVFIVGKNIHIYALAAARNLTANMNTLVSLGTLTAWGWSAGALFFNIDGSQDLPLYFETAIVFTLVVLFGQWLESRTTKGAHDSIARLNYMVPKSVLLETGEEILITDLKPKMRFRTREGEFVASDGVVVEGTAALDISMITGEPLNQHIKPGDEVIGSTIITKGSVIIEATRTGENTFHRHIMRLIEQTIAARPPIQKMADKVSAIYAYVVIAISVAALIGWLAVGNSFADAIQPAIAVLIIACPCALGLATPIAILAATSRSAKHGIVLKNIAALEQIKKVNVVALDKTGTLTAGKIHIANIVMAKDTEMSALELQSLAVELERHSTHPIGIAIAASGGQNKAEETSGGINGSRQNILDGKAGKKARNDKNSSEAVGISDIYIGEHTDNDKGEYLGETVDKGAIKDIQNIDGMGVAAERVQTQSQTQPQKIAIGKAELFANVPDDLAKAHQEAQNEGNIAVFCGDQNQPDGLIILSDDIRQDARSVVAELKELKMHPVMITGDSETPAKQLGAELGIEEIYHSVLPDQKAEIIRQLQNADMRDGTQQNKGGQNVNDTQGNLSNFESGLQLKTKKATLRNQKTVLMVGDGTNDAAALTTADLSIAIGSATEVALESADIALIGTDLTAVVTAIKLALKTRATIIGNLFWAFIYNSAAIPLAAFGLLSPIIAAVAMTFSSLFVVLNSVRLRHSKQI